MPRFILFHLCNPIHQYSQMRERQASKPLTRYRFASLVSIEGLSRINLFKTGLHIFIIGWCITLVIWQYFPQPNYLNPQGSPQQGRAYKVLLERAVIAVPAPAPRSHLPIFGDEMERVIGHRSYFLRFRILENFLCLFF